MTRNNINQDKDPQYDLWFADFWREGAFLRLANKDVVLWKGPWKKRQSAREDSASSKKIHDFTVSYMNFFDAKIAHVEAQDRKIFKPNELKELIAKLNTEKPLGLEPAVKKQNFSQARKEDFEKSLQIIQGKIHRTEIEKAVPVVLNRNEQAPNLADLQNWFINLLEAPANSYAYGMWNKDFGIMGATPEILFSSNRGLVKSMALAGTCPKSELSKRVHLLKDPKEMLEHQLVVEDLMTQLRRIGMVRKSETKVLELPTLLHLVTELEVESRGKGTEELMGLLHPTPALGVAPRAYGYTWMKDLPHQKERVLLGAPIAFQLSKEETLCVVAIRAIQWGSYGCQIGAGCGIVSTSELDREWDEVQQKLSSIFDLIRL